MQTRPAQLPKGIERHFPPKGTTSVLLLVPRYTRQAVPHHGVRYLAATLLNQGLLQRIAQGSQIEALRKAPPPQFYVRILDLSVAPADFDLNGFLEGFAPSLVGVTANAHSAGAAFKIADQVRKNRSTMNTPRIIGGYLPSADPLFALKGNFHVAVVGFGEETLGELALAWHVLGRAGFQHSLSQIPGISYREGNDTFHENKRRAYEIPLDDLPFPHTADNLQLLNHFPELAGLRRAFVVGARGCVNHCTYCSGHSVTLGKVRHRSAENILAEVKQLYLLGIRTIVFDEEDFMLRPKADLSNLLTGLKALKEQDLTFSWVMETRGDKLSPEAILAMASAGLTMMAFGAETLALPLARQLKQDPHLSLDKLQEATEAARTAGIEVLYNLMVGTPGCGWKEMLATAIALRESPPYWARVGIYKLYAGSPDYAASSSAQRQAIRAWQLNVVDANEDYPIFATAEMTEAEIRSAKGELEMLLFCLCQERLLAEEPEAAEKWTVAAHGIAEAFRISTLYDLFLNSRGNQHTRAELLKKLPEDVRLFFEKRAKAAKGFSAETGTSSWRDQKRLEEYLPCLITLNFPERTALLLDLFLQTVTVKGGFRLSKLPLQLMRKFILLILMICEALIRVQEDPTFPITRIVIEDDQAALRVATRTQDMNQAQLVPRLAQLLSGATNCLEAQGFLFELDRATKTLKIKIAPTGFEPVLLA